MRWFPGALWIGILSFLPATAAAQQVVEVPAIELQVPPSPPRSEAPESSRTDRLEHPEDLDAAQGPAAPLDRLPSVQVLHSGGPGQPVTIMIRGTDPSATLATLEGVPLNSPYMGGADLSSLSLVTLDSLELVRGARSASHGTDAIGGILTARAPDPLDGTGTRLSLTLGSFWTGRVKASHTHLWSRGRYDVGLLVGGGAQASQGRFRYTDTNGQTRFRDHNASQGYEGVLRLTGRIGETHRLDLFLEGALEDRQVAGLEQYPSTTARQWNSRAIVLASWEAPPLFGSEGVSRTRLHYRRLGFAYQDPRPPIGPAAKTRLVSHGLSAEVATEGRLTSRVSLSVALSGSFDRGDTRRQGQAPEFPSRLSLSGRTGARFGGLSDPWGVSVDARLEWDQGFGVRAIPALGVFGDPLPWLRLFGNLSRGFRLPTLEELHFDGGFVQGNPDLVPEDALTWDVGIALGRHRDWELSAAYFENRIRNLILFLPRSAFVVRAENSGAATLRGGEFRGRLSWRWFDLSAAYTLLDARFGPTGLRFPQRATHSVQGTLGLLLGPVRLQVRPGWQSRVFLDRFESLSEEGRFLLDARVEWQPLPGILLSLEGQNLTDKRDAVDHLQRPLPGMSFFLTARVER